MSNYNHSLSSLLFHTEEYDHAYITSYLKPRLVSLFQHSGCSLPFVRLLDTLDVCHKPAQFTMYVFICMAIIPGYAEEWNVSKEWFERLVEVLNLWVGGTYVPEEEEGWSRVESPEPERERPETYEVKTKGKSGSSNNPTRTVLYQTVESVVYEMQRQWVFLSK
jgi:hypothetical protein